MPYDVTPYDVTLPQNRFFSPRFQRSTYTGYATEYLRSRVAFRRGLWVLCLCFVCTPSFGGAATAINYQQVLSRLPSHPLRPAEDSERRRELSSAPQTFSIYYHFIDSKKAAGMREKVTVGIFTSCKDNFIECN